MNYAEEGDIITLLPDMVSPVNIFHTVPWTKDIKTIFDAVFVYSFINAYTESIHLTQL